MRFADMLKNQKNKSEFLSKVTEFGKYFLPLCHET